MPLPNIIKTVQTIRALSSAQEFGFKICSGEKTGQKKKKKKKQKKKTRQELFLFHAALLIDLMMSLLKFYQIISNSVGESLHKISASGEIST